MRSPGTGYELVTRTRAPSLSPASGRSTTLSPPLRPLRISTVPPCSDPASTGRETTRPFSTTHTRTMPPPRTSAAAGTDTCRGVAAEHGAVERSPHARVLDIDLGLLDQRV